MGPESRTLVGYRREKTEGTYDPKWRATGRRTLASSGSVLQEARRTVLRNGIYHRLTFENPAGHRKSQRRVTNMHQSHRPPPKYGHRPRYRRGGASLRPQISNLAPKGQ
jgi:hypothetical protein